jgi:ZIP family zinc transporter
MVLLGDIALGTSPRITAAIMMVSAGGILFLMFQAIAVKAHLQNKQAPSLAAVAGFAVGILAETLI